MSESNVNSNNLADVADINNNSSIGGPSSDKLKVDDGTSPASVFELDDFEKPPASPLLDKRTSGMTSMPSLSSFASLGLSDDAGEFSVGSGEDDGYDYENYDDDDDEDDEYDDMDEPEPEPEPETRSMPMIPGLEVSKDARPGTFLAELTVSADSLVNKRTPEKELGARWKDGSIPIATLMKQKQLNQELQTQNNKEKGDNEKKGGRGRRNSYGRRRLRSKSPPPPEEAAAAGDDSAGDAGSSSGLLQSSVAPVRPVRQVSVQLASPPMSPGVFSAYTALPVKPERKISMHLVSSNMVQSKDPLITPSPAAHEERSIQPNVGKSLPSIQLSEPDNNCSSPGSIPPLKPMRQTTRNLFDNVVETIAEDISTDDGEFEEDNDDDNNNKLHPIDQVLATNDMPSQPQRRETYYADQDMPSQPQRRETYYDDSLPLQVVEENFDADNGNEADEMPNQPQRQVTMDVVLGELHVRTSTRRQSLIDDE